jgi:hypothetical protein
VANLGPGWGGDVTDRALRIHCRLGLARRTIGVVTIKERLHKLIDQLSEPEADDALRYIAQRRVDPMVAAFGDAADDDEPFTRADEEALAEVEADRANGVPRVSFAEIKRKHG